MARLVLKGDKLHLSLDDPSINCQTKTVVAANTKGMITFARDSTADGRITSYRSYTVLTVLENDCYKSKLTVESYGEVKSSGAVHGTLEGECTPEECAVFFKYARNLITNAYNILALSPNPIEDSEITPNITNWLQSIRPFLDVKKTLDTMLKNKLYRYGNENSLIPAHLNYGKAVYDSMVQNKDMIAMINAATGEKMTYGEAAQMTADIAISLTRMGVKKGDVASICSEKRFEYLPTVIGIICAGAVFSPIDPTYGRFPLVHRLNIIRPKIMFCSVSAYDTHKKTFEELGSIETYIIFEDEAREGALLFKDLLTGTTNLENFMPVPVNGETDLVYIIFSSGTTGLSKGIPVTHYGHLINSQAVVQLDMFKGLCIYNTREFYNNYGLLYSVACLRAGSTTVHYPDGGEKEMMEAIQKYKTKLLVVVPQLITGLIKSPVVGNYDLSSVEYIVCASTYVREEEVKAVRQRLPNLVSVLQIYGMSEGGCICNELGSAKGPRPGSSGMPCLGFVIKVVDLETRQPLGPHQRGEICLKGPSILKQYMHNAHPDSKDEEGFLKTGDIGYYDEDGYFYIVNRIKELIKFRDFAIPPAEFEAILQQHEAVREACVVGKPHPEHGEVAVAFVVLQPDCDVTEQELVTLVESQVTFRMRLAGGVRFVDKLPRGTGDKLDRNTLKQILINEDK